MVGRRSNQRGVARTAPPEREGLLTRRSSRPAAFQCRATAAPDLADPRRAGRLGHIAS